MITSAKNYTKINKQTKKRADRTLGQMVKNKAIQTKSHKEVYTYTLTKKEKGKKLYIYKKIKEESNQINKQIYQ